MAHQATLEAHAFQCHVGCLAVAVSSRISICYVIKLHGDGSYIAAFFIGVTLLTPFFQVSIMFAHCCIILARSAKCSAWL